MWELWKNALRNAYQTANHLRGYRLKCQYRKWKPSEPFEDYFDDKEDLQRYLYSPETPDLDLIEDMLLGIPVEMVPNIKTQIKSDTTLPDFHRILVDLEPGLRQQFGFGRTGAPTWRRATTTTQPASATPT
jgi:hypothetical protein